MILRESIFYKFICISLIGLVVLSTMSFAMDMHFCQGNWRSSSFLGKAKSCFELQMCCQKEKSACSIEPTADAAKHKDCCENKTLEIEDTDQVISSSVVDFNAGKILQLTALFEHLQCSFKERLRFFQSYPKFHPPPLNRDLTVLIQSFLL